VRKGLGGDVTGAGTGELVGIDEESSVGITGVQGEHPVVDILLGTLWLVARSQQPAGTVREQTGLQSGGLGVVVVTVAISLRDVLQDDPPVTLNIDSPGDLGVVNIGGAKVTLRSDPVSGVVLAGSLAGASVVAVVEALLLRLGDHLHEVVSTLVSDVGVLLQEESVLADLGEIWALGTLRGSLGVTISVTVRSSSMVCWGVRSGAIGSRVVRGGGVMDGVMDRMVDQLVGPYDGGDQD
jgi:hypothetical protein